MRGNLPERISGTRRVPGGAWEEHYAGKAISDHERALCLGHPAGLDHAAVTTATGHPGEVSQQAAPYLPGIQGEQKATRAAGHHAEHSGTGAGRPLNAARVLTAAAPAPSTRGLGPAGSTRSRDLPGHAVRHLTKAMTGATPAPAPSAGPPALCHSSSLHPLGLQTVVPATRGLRPARRSPGWATPADASATCLGLPRVHRVRLAPCHQPSAPPLLPLWRPSLSHNAS